MVERIKNLLTVTGKDFFSRQPTATEPTFENLLSAIHWIFRTQDAINSEGSSAGYNLVLGWEDPYPETTGYIIPTLYACSDILEQRDEYEELAAECEDRADRMVKWLLEQQLSHGGYPAGTGTGNTKPSVFNTGQILLGLCSYLERHRDSETVQQQIKDACAWLVEVQNPDGSWDDHDYNSAAHAYSSRIAWPMLVSERIADLDDAVVDAAIANLDWVVDQQTDNGWFRRAGFEPDDTPYLHTIAYTIRGLLEAGIFLDESKYIDSSKIAANRLLQLQDRDEYLKGEYDSEWTPGSYYCLTGNAQMGIVWARLHHYTDEERWVNGVNKSAHFLSSLQSRAESTAINGAIKGSHPIWGSYMYFRYPNWATKFYIDALLEYERLSSLTAPTIFPR